MLLRIYADFNSRGSGGWCWCLRHNGQPLDEVAGELQLSEGQPIILYYEDPAEEFEFDALLSHRDGRWEALPDDSSYRLLRESK